MISKRQRPYYCKASILLCLWCSNSVEPGGHSSMSSNQLRPHILYWRTSGSNYHFFPCNTCHKCCIVKCLWRWTLHPWSFSVGNRRNCFRQRRIVAGIFRTRPKRRILSCIKIRNDSGNFFMSLMRSISLVWRMDFPSGYPSGSLCRWKLGMDRCSGQWYTWPNEWCKLMRNRGLLSTIRFSSFFGIFGKNVSVLRLLDLQILRL